VCPLAIPSASARPRSANAEPRSHRSTRQRSLWGTALPSSYLSPRLYQKITSARTPSSDPSPVPGQDLHRCRGSPGLPRALPGTQLVRLRDTGTPGIEQELYPSAHQMICSRERRILQPRSSPDDASRSALDSDCSRSMEERSLPGNIVHTAAKRRC
jgi:hypothetical protein